MVSNIVIGALCWALTIGEIIGFITYLCIVLPKTRRTIVSRGRLIQPIQMLVMTGGPANQMVRVAQPGYISQYQPLMAPAQQPPHSNFSPSAPSQDNPPSYASVK